MWTIDQHNQLQNYRGEKGFAEMKPPAWRLPLRPEEIRRLYKEAKLRTDREKKDEKYNKMCKPEVRPANNILEWGAFWGVDPIITDKLNKMWGPASTATSATTQPLKPSSIKFRGYASLLADQLPNIADKEDIYEGLQNEFFLNRLYEEKYPHRWITTTGDDKNLKHFAMTEDLETFMKLYDFDQKEEKQMLSKLFEEMKISTVSELLNADRESIRKVAKAIGMHPLDIGALFYAISSELFLRSVSEQRLKYCIG